MTASSQHSRRPTEQEDRKLAVFDMDGVLTRHPSSWEFVHEYAGVSNEDARLLYDRSEISYIDFLRSDVRLWISSGKVRTRGDLRKILSLIPVTVGLSETVLKLREMGFVTAIISGGLYDLAEIIDPGHILFDYVYANRIITDSDGNLIPEGDVMVEPNRKGEVLEKLQRELIISPDRTMSVGDSIQDLPLFLRSKVSVAVIHGDSEMRKIARHYITGDRFKDLIGIAQQV
ncbi:HAD-IB family phosphatase [Thermoplasmatales archaeon AK]|nr:HAD-IB family phosphatase [Thermoplasmatales archaeon AK]